MLVGLGTLRISFGILSQKLIGLSLDGISSLLLLALSFCLTLASFSFSFFLCLLASLALLFWLGKNGGWKAGWKGARWARPERGESFIIIFLSIY